MQPCPSGAQRRSGHLVTSVEHLRSATHWARGFPDIGCGHDSRHHLPRAVASPGVTSENASLDITSLHSRLLRLLTCDRAPVTFLLRVLAITRPAGPGLHPATAVQPPRAIWGAGA